MLVATSTLGYFIYYTILTSFTSPRLIPSKVSGCDVTQFVVAATNQNAMGRSHGKLCRFTANQFGRKEVN